MNKKQVKGMQETEQEGATVASSLNEVLQFWSGFKREANSLKLQGQKEAYNLTYLFCLTATPSMFQGVNQAKFRIAQKAA